MSIQRFIDKPWCVVHPAYDQSFLHMRPAPEYASGEVMLASTYRRIGFDASVVNERNTPTHGRKFVKLLEKGKRPGGENPSGIDSDSWTRLINGTLRSPKQPNQSSKRFLQVCPIVPDASLYSLSPRLSSNSWPAGELVARLIQFGSPDFEHSLNIWTDLHAKLSVTDEDDLWARFIQLEFESWRAKDFKDAWSASGPQPISQDSVIEAMRKSHLKTPSMQFVSDLPYIMNLKTKLTRRQWVSILESLLRIGTASHIQWVCSANSVVFQLVKAVLHGEPPMSAEELNDRLESEGGYWRYGQYASVTLTRQATGFLKARVGLNLLLFMLEDQFGAERLNGALSSIEDIVALMALLEEVRDEFDIADFTEKYQTVIESDPRQIAGKKGISSNIQEFLRHVLGQRQTAERGLDSYDQGYFLHKSGQHKSARWVVGLGPVSVIALVHACTAETAAPKTVQDFCNHLYRYGIEIEAQEIPRSLLGQTLRNLGLVLDSPDAEGGMVLVNPFNTM